MGIINLKTLRMRFAFYTAAAVFATIANAIKLETADSTLLCQIDSDQ